MSDPPLVHLQGRFLKLGLFSSCSWILVARKMQRRQEECTAAMSTSALKESEGPSYFHLKSKQTHEVFQEVITHIHAH